MSAVIGLRAAVTAHFDGHLPADVSMDPVDPAKLKAAAKGALWVHSVKSNAEFRQIGGGARAHRRRSEDLEVVLAALVYRESSSYLAAAADANERVEQIIAAVEARIEAAVPGTDDLSLSGAVDWSLLSEIEIETKPAESGCVAMTKLTLTCKSRPS